MKKILSLFALCLLLSALLGSCASHERCPGVGQVLPPTDVPV